ncbi:MAG: hypothetical protein N2246_00245 [Candidatus Sumerlaeia bacterium]|nr:hypothetical protein [Candidatus Sumerlaeia bacterium]
MSGGKIVKKEETLNDLKRLYELWIQFRKYYLKSFTTDPISREEEQAFLEIKSEIAKYQRVLGEEVTENLYFASDKIIELLRKSISVSHLRSLPYVDKQLYYKLWHYVFIHLGRTVGAYQFFCEGYVPPKQASKGDSAMTISKVKAMAGSAGEKGGKRKQRQPLPMGKIMGFILVIIIIGMLVLLLSRR